MAYILQGIGIGIGVFLGVVAGAFVQILVNNYYKGSLERQRIKNLKFEFEFNIKKLDSFLEEITKYRNAVNADYLSNYFGYFDLSRVISVTANNMFLDGSLYKLLDHDDIGKLQAFFSEYSFNGENYINNQMKNNATNFVKQTAVRDVDFWEKKFKDSKRVLQEIFTKIK